MSVELPDIKLLTPPEVIKNHDGSVSATLAGFRHPETQEYLVVADSTVPSFLDSMQVRTAAYNLRIPMNLHNSGLEPRLGPFLLDQSDSPPALVTGKTVHRRVFRLNLGI